MSCPNFHERIKNQEESKSYLVILSEKYNKSKKIHGFFSKASLEEALLERPVVFRFCAISVLGTVTKAHHHLHQLRPRTREEGAPLPPECAALG